MASISERKKKNGQSSWQVLIRNKHLAPITKTFPTRTEAEEFAYHIHNKLKSSPPKPLNLDEAQRLDRFKKEKLIDLLTNFAACKNAKPRHKNILPTIAAHVGDIKVGQIRKSWVKNFVNCMREKTSRTGRPYKDSTIGAFIWTINAAAKWRADELDLPPQNLSLNVSSIDGQWDIKRDRRLAADEEAAILARLDRIELPQRFQWMALFQLALETAARQQELVGALWNEFDLEKRTWIIPKHRTKVKKARAVPLTRKALALLTQLRLESEPGNPRVFTLIGAMSNTVSTCFHRYTVQAGVVDFRFHDCRHEAASRMALYWRNFTMFEIMLIVGHTRMEMFQRYANLRADELAKKLND